MRWVVLGAMMIGLAVCAPRTALALDADDLSDLLGYTMVAFTNVDGEFEGADFDKPVKLENGMVFEFTEYNYSYSYQPTVAVFAEHFSAADMIRAGIKDPRPSGMTSYKLIIDDTIYDVRRLK